MGQLRIWPGGMANARAIGDFGAGHLLISSPHITQVQLPRTQIFKKIPKFTFPKIILVKLLDSSFVAVYQIVI